MSTDIADNPDFLRVMPAALLLQRDNSADKSLIQAIACGDVGAVELIYDHYSGLLYSFSLRMVADRLAAEDILQDVLVAIWQRASSYDPQSGTVHSWLMSITHNRAIDYLRKLGRYHALKAISWEGGELDAGISSSDVWDEVWRSVQSSMVRECLMCLLDEQREVIELAYFQGLTQAEIARSRQIPLGTVKARMRLGLLRLRRELEKRGMVG